MYGSRMQYARSPAKSAPAWGGTAGFLVQGSSKLRTATAKTGLHDVYAKALAFRGSVVGRYRALATSLSDLLFRMSPSRPAHVVLTWIDGCRWDPRYRPSLSSTSGWIVVAGQGIRVGREYEYTFPCGY